MDNNKKSKIEYDSEGNPKISLCRIFKIFKKEVNTKLESTIDQMIEHINTITKDLNLEQKDDNKIKELEKENTELKDKIKELEEAKKENEFYDHFFRKCVQEIIEEEQAKQKQEITVEN